MPSAAVAVVVGLATFRAAEIPLGRAAGAWGAAVSLQATSAAAGAALGHRFCWFSGVSIWGVATGGEDAEQILIATY